MKKLLIFASIITIILSACSSESAVKNTVTEHLKKQMRNPDSFKIESIEVRKDTVPQYITNDLLSLADKASDALEEYTRYQNLGYLWADEKYESSKKMFAATSELQTAYDQAMKEKPTVEFVAYVKFSGTNAMGGTVSNSAIVIVDSKDTNKILGTFNIDQDFVKQFVTIKMVGSKFNFNLEQNKFGKYETDGLPYFEKFIIDGAE